MSQTGQPGGAPGPGGMPPAPPPQAPPPPSWQSTPQPPMPPAQPPGAAPAPQLPAWTAKITDRSGLPGPAGTTLADIPMRLIAYIIDGIILSIGLWIIDAIFGTIFPGLDVHAECVKVLGSQPCAGQGGGIGLSLIGFVLVVAIFLVGSAAYFIYTWTTLRASIGMRLMGIQVGVQTDGRVLSMNQAVMRYLVLWLPWAIGALLSKGVLSDFLWDHALTPGSILGSLFQLVGVLLTVGWAAYLLMTTAQSPTREGFHDKFANSIVTRAAGGGLLPPR